MAIARRANVKEAETVSPPQIIEAKSETDYLNSLSALMASRVGVVITRTSEPYRALEVIQRRAYVGGKEVYTWDAFYGWQWSVGEMPNASDGEEGRKKRAVTPDRRERKYDLTTVAMPVAIREISGIKPAGVMAPPATAAKGAARDVRPDFGTVGGLFAMVNSHWVLMEGKKDPSFVQAIKTYSNEWLNRPPSDPKLEKTLILICPPDFTVPSEIESDVRVLDMNLPTQHELSESLRMLITHDLVGIAVKYDESLWTPYIRSAAGLTGHEFITNTLQLVRKPENLSRFRENTIDAEVVSNMARDIGFIKAEMLKRTQILEMMDSEDMKNVGGLDLFKTWLSQRADCFSDKAKAFGIKPPKGVTLVGTPGTGKSLVAKCASKILGVPLIRFDVGKVFNSLVGASESRMRVALGLVDAMSPCVLLLDEVDKMFDRNVGGGDSGVSKRIMGSFLTWMQESKSPVFVIMTANRTSGLPPEMLRRGRIDEIFSVTLPSPKERKEILDIHIKKRGHDPEKLDLDGCVNMSVGYIPAELESAVQEALIKAYHEDSENPELKASHIEQSLSEIIPLSQSFGEDFAKMHEWCTKNARPSSSFESDMPSQIAESGVATQEGGSDAPRSFGGGLDG